QGAWKRHLLPASRRPKPLLNADPECLTGVARLVCRLFAIDFEAAHILRMGSWIVFRPLIHFENFNSMDKRILLPTADAGGQVAHPSRVDSTTDVGRPLKVVDAACASQVARVH